MCHHEQSQSRWPAQLSLAWPLTVLLHLRTPYFSRFYGIAIDGYKDLHCPDTSSALADIVLQHKIVAKWTLRHPQPLSPSYLCSFPDHPLRHDFSADSCSPVSDGRSCSHAESYILSERLFPALGSNSLFVQPGRMTRRNVLFQLLDHEPYGV